MPLDAILVKFGKSQSHEGDAVRAAVAAAQLDCRTITVHAALSGRIVYAYAWLAVPLQDEAESITHFARALLHDCGAPDAVATVLPLELLMDLKGAATGETARYHYVVETGVDSDHERDFNAWYDSEHLRGLAAVPGCVRARRLRALEKVGERAFYLACYDLVSDQALTSEAWLAVRRTPWSDRVRPTFRDTTRTVFRTVERISASASAVR